jgi:hypothetical protein
MNEFYMIVSSALLIYLFYYVSPLWSVPVRFTIYQFSKILPTKSGQDPYLNQILTSTSEQTFELAQTGKTVTTVFAHPYFQPNMPLSNVCLFLFKVQGAHNVTTNP